MKILKRLLLALAVLVILLIGAAAAIPYFFKDELVTLLKDEINKNVRAEVDFADVSLSLFRSFPDFSLRIEDYSVTGIEEFADVPLAKGEAIGLTLDLFSVFRSEDPIRVKAVELRRPDIKVYVTAGGAANYDIAVPTDERIEETAEEGDFSNFRVALESYEITDAALLYDDRSADTYLKIAGLNHRGSGDFTLDVYDLDTRTDIAELTVRQGGVAYLNQARAALDAVLNIDQRNSKYTLKDNELTLNALVLQADGYVQLADEDIKMDLDFAAPSNDFKHLLSLIPNAYIEGYESVKASGQFALQGTVEGTYNGEREAYPAFQVNLSVSDGQVKYPDLPLGISDIAARASVNSPSSDFDDMVIDVPDFRIKIADNPFRSRFTLRTPISDPDLDAEMEGVIDLSQLAQAYPMEGVEALSGVIEADVQAKTRMSYIDREQYDRVTMAGNLKLSDLQYQGAGQPPVNIREADLGFTPQNVALRSFDAQLGRSDVQASGTIDNILAYFSPEQTMIGKLKVASTLFDANEWAPSETGETNPATAGELDTAATTEIFDRFDFTLDARCDKILYDEYELTNTVLAGHMTPNRLRIDQAATVIGNSDIAASGVITHIFDYLYDGATLGGNLNIRSRQLDLNQFMVAEAGSGAPTETPEGTEELEPIAIPANIGMRVQADVDKLTYTNLVLRNLQGVLLVEDQAVVIEEATTDALGGSMAFSGGYDTKNAENPEFNLKYDLQQLNFQETFQAFNTFQQLAPIGKFISGTLNSTLIMDGKLGKDLMPQLNTLNAQGFLETLDGVIRNFKPLQAVGNALDVQELKSAMAIKNTRNWFEITNGVVEVKPFDWEVKDIAMNIAGTHGLDRAMDYRIEAQVPRELLEKNAVGQAAGQGFDALAKEAAKLGVQIEKGEFVNVLINLTGSLTDPKVKMKFLGIDGETSVTEAAKEKVSEELEKKKEELKAEAEEKIEEGKEKVRETAETAIDSARTVAEEKIDEAKEQVESEVKKKVEEAAGEAVGAAVDTLLKGKGEEAADEIKDKLDKFNPFKKKKDGGG